jgi:D-aminopeptidase
MLPRRKHPPRRHWAASARHLRSRIALTLALLGGAALLGCRPVPGEPAAAPAGQSPAPPSASQPKARARDLGIPFEGTPGPYNAITDVQGVEVGHCTLISGEGKLIVGKGPVRTGVTAIFPRGKGSTVPVFAGWFSLNGNGEMTGTTWVEESGLLTGPVMLTNTNSVGTVRDAVIAWAMARFPGTNAAWDFALPVVAETWDGFLNDIAGFHVKKEHAFEAMDRASSGPVTEGNVGGGTGMMAYRFKGGIGTASRKLGEAAGGYLVGALVQANYGQREDLKIAGVPVGAELTDLLPVEKRAEVRDGSIIAVVATDAPLLPHQLKRVARRVSLGIGRLGGLSRNSSGDIFIAMSTANAEAARGTTGPVSATLLPNDAMDPIFAATVQATEEAIVNAMIAAETMTGINGSTVYAIPHARLRAALAKYNR